jgi:hypothetical protein
MKKRKVKLLMPKKGNRTDRRGHRNLVGGKASRGSRSVSIRLSFEIIRQIKKKSKKYGGRSNYVRKLILKDLKK